jgi:carboxymethylenebutenolidase
MSVTTRTETVTALDGGRFDAHVTLPESGSGPGILLLQEIFGINDYLRSVGSRLADLGFVVLSPDVFWRIERNIDLPHDEGSLQKAFGYVQQFDIDQGIEDCGAALTHLRALPEVTDKVGVLGFCLGGRLAYHVAARSEPDAAVSYYGSGIADMLDEAEQISCPILFHFGSEDPFIPNDQVERIQARFGSQDHVEVAVQQGAGHAFDNHMAAMFHNPDAAAAAWRLTVEFLDRTLPR